MAVNVTLLPHQERFMQSPFVFPDIRYFFLCGGFACGKTSSLVYAVMYTIKHLLGKKDNEGHNPRILVASKNITFLKKTFLNSFEQNLKNTNSSYTFDKAANIMTVGNVVLLFIGIEYPEDVYGFDCCAAFVDELDELPTSTAMEAVKAVNDRVRQKVEDFRSPYIMFATTSQGLKGLYNTVIHFRKQGIGYVLMRARTCDNTFLPKDYVDNMYAIYNEKERRCLLEGEFISIDSGLVYPDYDPEKNLLDVDIYDTLTEDDTVYIGGDFNSFGNHAVAVVVKKFAKDSCIVAVKDYNFPDVRRAPQVFRYDFPVQKIVWVPDMTYKEHFSEFKKELRVYNIKIAYRAKNPLVRDRIFACNKLLYAGRLFITPICKDLEKALLTHQKDPKTGEPMKGGANAPDHVSDAMQYAVHYLLSWHKDLKPLYDVTLRYLYEHRENNAERAFEADGYSPLHETHKMRVRMEEPVNN